MLACICGGTLELLAAIGIPSLLGIGAWIWDHLTLKKRLNKCKASCQHTESCDNQPKEDNANVGTEPSERGPSGT